MQVQNVYLDVDLDLALTWIGLFLAAPIAADLSRSIRSKIGNLMIILKQRLN